jgi:hypothetical protein
MQNIFALISFSIIIAVTIPYMIDIVKGRAKPARAARTMLLLLIIVTLAQQHSLGTGLTMALTIGEIVSSIMLFGLAMKHGVGGLSKNDLICYVLLGVSLVAWWMTGNALLALHLSILADTIAFWPTLEKTWREPKSETQLFFWGGVIAPWFSIAAGGSLAYSVIVFPVYISIANFVEVVLISRPQK